MPKQVRTKKQVSADRRALKILKSSGLIKKANLSKKPTSYQRGLINKFSDVISGKAQVVKPADPKSYKSLFRVVGDKVIVPKRKGEKIKVTAKGSIIGERKVSGRTVRSRYRRVKSDADLSDKKRTMFFVPFIRGRDAKGKPILEWKRFPTKELLLNIMGGYESRDKNPYSNWQDYVIEERIDADQSYSMSSDLQKRLDRKLGSGKRKKIRFNDDTDLDGDE